MRSSLLPHTGALADPRIDRRKSPAIDGQASVIKRDVTRNLIRAATLQIVAAITDHERRHERIAAV